MHNLLYTDALFLDMYEQCSCDPLFLHQKSALSHAYLLIPTSAFVLPNDGLGHPKNKWLGLWMKTTVGSKYPKNTWFNFENRSTDTNPCNPEPHRVFTHFEVSEIYSWQILRIVRPLRQGAQESLKTPKAKYHLGTWKGKGIEVWMPRVFKNCRSIKSWYLYMFVLHSFK